MTPSLSQPTRPGNASTTVTVDRNSSLILAAESYVRERREPRIGDLLYLALTDIKDFVGTCAEKLQGPVLDYGSGGAPYKDLFTAVDRYVCADMLPGPGIDLVLQPNGKTGEPAGSY